MTTPTPARVSGPGQLSQRTDGGQPLRDLPDARYGEAKALMDQQRAAPLANGPDRPSAPAGVSAPGAPAGPSLTPSLAAGAAPEVTPLTAPTAYPDQPVTTGMAPIGQPPQRQAPRELRPGEVSQALAPYIAADDTGQLADFAWRLAELGL